MFSGLRSRLTYANVVATLAMVFAMSGGALAASKYLITSAKQIKPSVLASLKGKAGANGANGAQGPAGPAGPTGPAGATGSQGPAGATGAKGETGPAGKAGKAGLSGSPGSPWTAGGVLPAGQTERGAWVVPSSTEFPYEVPIVFPILHLSQPLPKGSGHFISTSGKEINSKGEEVESAACKGSASEPTAEPGNLCIYAKMLSETAPNDTEILDPANGVEGVGKTGALFSVGSRLQEGEPYSAYGTWAVTAPVE